MTHCSGYRAAVVARARDLRTVGIDAEPHAPVCRAALDLLLRNEERALLGELATRHPHVHWDRVLFCAKEAVYKAWFPLTRKWLDFTDVSVTTGVDGTFRARVSDPAPSVDDLAPDGFAGRWLVGRGLIVAATSLRPRQREGG